MAGSTRTKQSGGGTNGSGRRRLVIVESPTKASKIASYLGPNYVVQSSRGHIRDLPRKAAEVPAKYKGESWSNLGVNVDNDFEPIYIVTPDKKSTVAELKEALKDVDELYLATDGDREGEAIAWHLLETLKPTIPVRRMVFHEITAPAILAAAENPRDLDTDLVEAYETRRILDRLYGYEVSPVLWKKVMPKLSAGRVQSVETRIVVERERERMRFVTASYWDVAATMDAGAEATPRTFGARLTSVDGTRLATGRDFGSNGQLKPGADVRALEEADARRLSAALADAPFTVTSVEEKPFTPEAVPAVHHVHPAAGGGPQAAVLRQPCDERRAAAVRERLHHLHAYRLDHAVGDGAGRRPRAGHRAVRRRVRARPAAPLRPQGEERAGGTRGDPARRARCSVRPARWPVSCSPTSSGCTS